MIISVVFGLLVFLWNIFTGYGHLIEPQMIVHTFEKGFKYSENYYKLFNLILVVGFSFLAWVLYQMICYLKMKGIGLNNMEDLDIKISALFAIITMGLIYFDWFNFFTDHFNAMRLIYQIYLGFILVCTVDDKYTNNYLNLEREHNRIVRELMDRVDRDRQIIQNMVADAIHRRDNPTAEIVNGNQVQRAGA